MDFNEPIIPDEHLFEDVNLGAKAESFLKHDPLGRLLADRALFEYKEAVMDFEGLTTETILSKPEKVAGIHNKMVVARNTVVWLNKTITNGMRAEEELKNRDMSDEVID